MYIGQDGGEGAELEQPNESPLVILPQFGVLIRKLLLLLLVCNLDGDRFECLENERLGSLL